MVKNLKMLREKKGISQNKLATDLGIARYSICDYETGRTEPDIETLIKLSVYFNVSIDELVGNNNDNYLTELQRDFNKLNKEDQKQIKRQMKLYETEARLNKEELKNVSSSSKQ